MSDNTQTIQQSNLLIGNFHDFMSDDTQAVQQSKFTIGRFDVLMNNLELQNFLYSDYNHKELPVKITLLISRIQNQCLHDKGIIFSLTDGILDEKILCSHCGKPLRRSAD